MCCTTCQDLETLDLDDFQHNNLNLTGLRLVQRSRGFVQDLLLQMRVYENRSAQPELYILNSTGVISVSQRAARPLHPQFHRRPKAQA